MVSGFTYSPHVPRVGSAVAPRDGDLLIGDEGEAVHVELRLVGLLGDATSPHRFKLLRLVLARARHLIVNRLVLRCQRRAARVGRGGRGGRDRRRLYLHLAAKAGRRSGAHGGRGDQEAEKEGALRGHGRERPVRTLLAC